MKDRSDDLLLSAIERVRKWLSATADEVETVGFDFERIKADRDFAYDNLTLVQERCWQLTTRIRDHRAFLRSIEWSGHRGWGPPCCPACEGFQPGAVYGDRTYKAGEELGGVPFGHAERCELVRLLNAQ